MIKKSDKTNRILHDEEKKDASSFDVFPRSSFSFGEKLARNLALAGMCLLLIASVRNERLPSGQTVRTAIQQIIQPNLNESLGKISFVSKLLPETAAVFFETQAEPALTAPCFGGVSHAWSATEPYVSFRSENNRVYAAADGEVMSVAHGMEEETILRIRHDNGLETFYYNLAQSNVKEGDPVREDTCVGTLLAGKEAAFEVRRAGISVDPAGFLRERGAP